MRKKYEGIVARADNRASSGSARSAQSTINKLEELRNVCAGLQSDQRLPGECGAYMGWVDNTVAREMHGCLLYAHWRQANPMAAINWDALGANPPN